MGNNTSNNNNLIKSYASDILNYDCNILDIKNRMGGTGYIDFIKSKELNNNDIMKGKDMHERPFFVLKATYIHNNGNVTHTISTFFQRYTSDNNLWVSCGMYMNLLHSEGGLSEKQLCFVKELIYNKEVILDFDKIKELRLNCYPNPLFPNEPVDLNLCPSKVVFGHIEKQKEEEHVEGQERQGEQVEQYKRK